MFKKVSRHLRNFKFQRSLEVVAGGLVRYAIKEVSLIPQKEFESVLKTFQEV